MMSTKIVLIIFALYFVQIQAWTIWPQPQSVSKGNDDHYVLDASTFAFSLSGDIGSDGNAILKGAFIRYNSLIFWRQTTDSAVSRKAATPLKQLVVTVTNGSADLQAGVDESYTLIVSPPTATLKAQTVWGALRGLESFSHLVDLQIETNGAVTYFISNGPIKITDSPRFPHRGLLLDSSRHFLPVSTILRSLDAMSYNKLNVLHWHIVDAIAFPMQSTQWPGLTKGAYRPDLTYSKQDVQRVVQYARMRGIRVLPEFDTPGHAYAWGVGVPGLTAKCPSWSKNPNNVALNPTPTSPTYAMLDGFLGEMSQIFPENYLHTGGDEVVFQCWQEDTNITGWMAQNNMPTFSAVMQYYENKLWATVHKYNKKVMAWEEVFNGYNLYNFPSDIVIQVWKDEETLISVAKSQLQGILSYGWYLDHPQNNWVYFYTHEPFDSAEWTPALEKYIIGGEASAWGELVDQYNVDQTLWPKSSATAERLWSNKAVTDVNDATVRLNDHICRMNRRGIAATPINPGFCPDQ